MDPSNQTNELLNEICKNAAMGAGTVTHLLEGKRSRAMSETLAKQKAEYSAILRQAEQSLRERGERPAGLSPAEKMRTDVGVTLNTLFDRSDSNVAKLLMNGSTMGVVNAGKSLSKYPDADPAARALMQRLSAFEEATIDVMKPFL